MSRTVQFAKAGAPEVLEFVEHPVRAPGPHEVRIKVKAIGINRAESMWRLDDYIEPIKFPAGLGYEAAGVVDAVGAEVTGIAAGDEVNVMPSFSMNDYGTSLLDTKQNTNIGGLSGLGLAYEISPSFDIRAEYRGFLAKAPNFNYANVRTNRYEWYSVPTIGVAYHF